MYQKLGMVKIKFLEVKSQNLVKIAHFCLLCTPAGYTSKYMYRFFMCSFMYTHDLQAKLIHKDSSRCEFKKPTQTQTQTEHAHTLCSNLYYFHPKTPN